MLENDAGAWSADRTVSRHRLAVSLDTLNFPEVLKSGLLHLISLRDVALLVTGLGKKQTNLKSSVVHRKNMANNELGCVNAAFSFGKKKKKKRDVEEISAAVASGQLPVCLFQTEDFKS